MAFEVKKRPFSIEPVTGIMMPDGIFDTAIPQQNIACYFTNTSDATINGLSVWIKEIGDPGIVVPYQVQHAADIRPGASVLLEFPASFVSASPGKVDVTFAYNYSFGISTHMAMVGNVINPLEIEQQIFVSETTFDDATQTYTCTVPEGTLQMKIRSVIAPQKLKKWKQPAYALKSTKIGVKKSRVDASDAVVLEARFYRNASRKLKGDELYVSAMLLSPSGHMRLVRLRDEKNDGVYVARFVPAEVAAGWALKAEHIRGDWRAYVLAQDVNDADPSMDPAEAATHIGSFPVHTPFKIHIKPNPTCPEPADAIVTVT